MNSLKNRKNIVIIVILLAIAAFSFFYLGNKFSSPETYSDMISILDEKKTNVMGLTASTSAASIAITVIPDDIGTPIANQLADLSGYLLIILTVIYLEKYLLTVIGFAVFKVIIPLGCILYGIYVVNKNNQSLRKAALKISIFGIALMLLIPTSVKVSNMIDNTYQESINETLSQTNQEIVVDDQKEETAPQEDLKWYEKIFNVFSNAVEDVKETVTSSTTEAIAKAKNMLSNFIEATAVMIVTSCVIPIVTVIIFVWLTKIILGIELNKPKLIEFKNNKTQPINIIETKNKDNDQTI